MIQLHKDPVTQGFSHTRIQSHKDSVTQGFSYTRIQSHKDSVTQGFSHTRIQSVKLGGKKVGKSEKHYSNLSSVTLLTDSIDVCDLQALSGTFLSDYFLLPDQIVHL